MTLHRRTVLQAGVLAAALPAAAQETRPSERRFDPRPGAWRNFELTTEVNVQQPAGTTRVWLPLPDVEDSDWQRVNGHAWSGNASAVQVAADAPRGVRMLYAEFPPEAGAPRLAVTTRIATCSRAVDWNARETAREDPAVLRAALQPTELIPTDGIVRSTAQQVTRGAGSDVEKVRAIYDWLVANGFREPKVRGCGTGDIRTMLETGNLGGKCADLNAVFVGLARASGVPARDVYGVRLAPSAFGYKELGANPANLKGAQHCRAEVFLRAHGWVAMDPADVLKVMRQETNDWIKDPKHPVAAPVKQALFGAWEGNWAAYNTAHDVRLHRLNDKATLPFLMYPQGMNATGRFDELAPDAFKYTITSREV